MIELFNLPTILGMLPLLAFIVLALMGKSQILSLLIATVLAMILSGTGAVGYSMMLAGSMGSSLVLIGLVIMMSSALGKIMETTGVSQTIVNAIISKIGIKTEKSAIIVTMICSTLVCGILGTIGGGNSILAPIIIPVVASVGLSKSTVGAIFQNAGETGLIIGPLSPAVMALLSITGLSYGRMLLTAALPYAIVWLVTSYFAIKRVQATTKDINPYTDENFGQVFVPTDKHRRLTLLFCICFIGFIIYSVFAKAGIPLLVFIMMTLSIILGAASGEKPDHLFKVFAEGMASAVPLFIIFLLFSPLFEMMTVMGGFQGMAMAFGKLVNLIGGSGTFSKAVMTILASFVGGFGIEGAAVVQMQITHELFSSALSLVQLPMELWALALIAASRITSVIYPTGNMIGQMGVARSDDVKSMLKVGWSVAGFMMVFICIYAFVGAAFLF